MYANIYLPLGSLVIYDLPRAVDLIRLYVHRSHTLSCFFLFLFSLMALWSGLAGHCLRKLFLLRVVMKLDLALE
jgi:hypothetical protein